MQARPDHVVDCAGLGIVFAGDGVGDGVDGAEEGAVQVRVRLKAAVVGGFFLSQLVVGGGNVRRSRW